MLLLENPLLCLPELISLCYYGPNAHLLINGTTVIMHYLQLQRNSKH